MSQAVPAVGDVGNLPRATAVAYASGSSEAILVAEVPQSRAELCSDNLPVTGNQPASGEERDSSLIECVGGEHSNTLRTGSRFRGPRCQVRKCRQWEVAKQAPLAHCAADAGGLARINITVQLRANTCTARLDCAQAPKKGEASALQGPAHTPSVHARLSTGAMQRRSCTCLRCAGSLAARLSSPAATLRRPD